MRPIQFKQQVAPLVGAWIETIADAVVISLALVAPLVGAWIETWLEAAEPHASRVAPLVGAWIETNAVRAGAGAAGVAPLVGAWIETVTKLNYKKIDLSHPSWVRGLKLSKVYPITLQH